MNRNVKRALMDIRAVLKRTKILYQKYNSNCREVHTINNNYKHWNCPIDGLDYAITMIDIRIGIRDNTIKRKRKA